MELLDMEMYQRIILPGILEQVVSCKEPISQEYLMECLIQVVSDFIKNMF
jgi:vacuolar protein sorting-associated protein 35